jgi:hypothetical protein
VREGSTITKNDRCPRSGYVIEVLPYRGDHLTYNDTYVIWQAITVSNFLTRMTRGTIHIEYGIIHKVVGLKFTHLLLYLTTIH